MANPKIRGKARIRYQECRYCSHRFSTDLVQCPSCKQWNWEERASADDGTSTLADAPDRPLRTMQTGPWDICFSNQSGVVPGPVITGVTLLGGAPGAGKSTMSLQLASCIARTTKREVLYVAAEEDKEEIRARAIRLGITNLELLRVYPLGTSSDLGNVLNYRKPAGIIVDSIQGLTEDPAEQASICKNFKGYAVALEAPVVIVSHVNKDRDFAGFMAMQFFVDTLLTFFPVQVKGNDDVRLLESVKNRFGQLAEKALLMTEKGLVEYHEPDNDT